MTLPRFSWVGAARQNQQGLNIYRCFVGTVLPLEVPGTSSWQHLLLAPHLGRGEMVRRRNFKYLTSRGSPQIGAGAYLYDLRCDPEELDNLGLQSEHKQQSVRTRGKMIGTEV